MERQMTADSTALVLSPRINLRLLVWISIAFAVAVLATAIVVAGPRSSTGAEAIDADLLRWEAIADSFEGAPPAALAASAARWNGLAAEAARGRVAEAERWSALADHHQGLSAAQSAYAARLRAAAGQ